MTAILMLLSPIVIVGMIMLIYLGMQEYEVYDQASDVYFDTLYEINSNLINADRDFYQAMIAATLYYDMENFYKDSLGDSIQGYLDQKLAEFDENKEQAVDRVNAALAIARENADIYTGTIAQGDTKNFADYARAFEAMLVLLRETEEGNKQILHLVEVLDGDKNTIMDSVESLSSVSQQNAAATEETSASLSMLETNMEHVVSQAQSLKNISDRLQENISIFKV